jgi:hypothetical protein
MGPVIEGTGPNHHHPQYGEARCGRMTRPVRGGSIDVVDVMDSAGVCLNLEAGKANNEGEESGGIKEEKKDKAEEDTPVHLDIPLALPRDGRNYTKYASQLIDEEEACAGVGESTIDAPPVPLQAMASLYVQKSRLAPESGEEIMDQKAARTVETIDNVIGDYAFPARRARVLPTDRPPPNSRHPFEVRKDQASPQSRELIDKTHACVIEAVLGEYAFPTLLFVPTDRPPPKPGEPKNTKSFWQPISRATVQSSGRDAARGSGGGERTAKRTGRRYLMERPASRAVMNQPAGRTRLKWARDSAGL